MCKECKSLYFTFPTRLHGNSSLIEQSEYYFRCTCDMNPSMFGTLCTSNEVNNFIKISIKLYNILWK